MIRSVARFLSHTELLSVSLQPRIHNTLATTLYSLNDKPHSKFSAYLAAKFITLPQTKRVQRHILSASHRVRQIAVSWPGRLWYMTAVCFVSRVVILLSVSQRCFHGQSSGIGHFIPERFPQTSPGYLNVKKLNFIPNPAGPDSDSDPNLTQTRNRYH